MWDGGNIGVGGGVGVGAWEGWAGMKRAVGIACGLGVAAGAVAWGLAWGAGEGGGGLVREFGMVDPVALGLAADDLAARHPEALPAGEHAAVRARIGALAAEREGLLGELGAGVEGAAGRARDWLDFRLGLLLRDPDLAGFESVLFVRRKAEGNLGLPANWQGNSCLPPQGWDNEVARLAWPPDGRAPATVLRPPGGGFVGDIRLDFDARRALVSMPGSHGRWQVHELDLASGATRELPLINHPQVDNFEGCYLPDGGILFSSTAPFQGVPCVRGSSHVANLYRMEPGDGRIRRLTFDQDHAWNPVVRADGRVMYLRWEYSDLPHFVSRILFTMNPDGTNQAEFYGSNSYWPNSLFFAQPLPGSATRFCAIVSGHHGVARMGELVVFDAARGRHEAAGAVQRVPGRGKPVEPVLLDQLVDGSWPRFLHPCPLDGEHFLVAMQPDAAAPWGLYLVDVFDNLVLLREEPGQVLFEPVAVRPRPRPPVPPSRVDEAAREAVLYLEDVHAGPGLAGVPRGTVKALRVVGYSFSYHGMGGQIDRVGLDGPWDVKRILGTVPVEADGSARFTVPANTPVALQPLDADGRALALMRSWTTAMPGEQQSCAGCHEPQSRSPGGRPTLAAGRAPSPLSPWLGPARGFGFEREVQPVLDRHCTGCHGGAAGNPEPDLTRRPPVLLDARDPGYIVTPFPPAYLALRRYVRGHTIESDMHLLTPAEFHGSTTELLQMLERGHHGVRLGREDWERLATWIDLNTPAWGTWTEIVGAPRVEAQAALRREMDRRYAGLDVDEEWIAPGPAADAAAAGGEAPGDAGATAGAVAVPAPGGWPFDAAAAAARQKALERAALVVDLGGGVVLELVHIPAGEFVAGGSGRWDGAPRPARVERPFWIGRTEVTNEQYARFDPGHDSRLEHGDFLQFSVEERGWPLNEPRQPVCRVAWERARGFCRWLAERAGRPCDLPTEDQWEWACRAGSGEAYAFGGQAAGFPAHANLADDSFAAVQTLGWNLPSGAIPWWRPAATGCDDGRRVAAPAALYQPNAWGVHDAHGNVWEWTLGEEPAAGGEPRRVARGGSWADRPERATCAARISYPPWQRVYNVGFRVVCAE